MDWTTSEVRFPTGVDIFLFATMSRPAVGSTQLSKVTDGTFSRE